MGEYALVEDRARTTHKNPIVACVTRHRLEVYFGSVDRAFGKPELIATDPEYRSGDWVRRLMLEMVHPELDTRGDVLQFMPGIQYFYHLLYASSAVIENKDTLPPLVKDTEP